MNFQEELILNKFGQSLLGTDILVDRFTALDVPAQRSYLSELSFLILQSKANGADLEQAIQLSNLKYTHTPCVLLKKEFSANMFGRVISLPEHELPKVLLIFLYLFFISYKRRFELEKNDKNKWWYWDLSDERIIDLVIRQKGNSL